jgi:hypothetical protein
MLVDDLLERGQFFSRVRDVPAEDLFFFQENRDLGRRGTGVDCQDIFVCHF